MQNLYTFVCEEASKTTTEAYSTSFSLGIKTLHSSIQQPIFNIYGFMRFSDEIVDTFHDHEQRTMLDEFKEETFRAIERGISTNPILHSFQGTVNQYNIPHELIDQFFNSMYMDLEDIEYDQETYETYLLGSAETVGLMCLSVFVDGDRDEYKRLEPYARTLGGVFQKVNFLRDMEYDYKVLDRTYFPDVDFEAITDDDLQIIFRDIEADFNQSLIGIKQLSEKARFGVYLAYQYYRKLFEKIENSPKEKLLNERIRIPNMQKYRILAKSYVQHKSNQYE